MSDIQKEVTQAMGLSKKMELALDLAGLEIRKVDNRRENIGLHPCLAFAIQLRKVVVMSADQNSKSVVDPEQTLHSGPTAPVLFRYTNHEGKTRVRSAVIKRIFFCATKWHKEPQWIIRAFCTEHQADRDFALRDCDFLSLNRKQQKSPVVDDIVDDLEKSNEKEDNRPKHLDGTPLTDAEIKENERAYYHDADGDCSND